MSLPPLFERFLHRIREFPDPIGRIATLHAAVEAQEEALEHLAAQYEVRMRADLRQQGVTEHDQVEFLVHDLRKTTTQQFPKMFRGGLLIAIWSAFESSLKDLADYTSQRTNVPALGFRSGGMLNHLAQFFEGSIGVTAFPDAVELRALKRIQGFRNALAHRDGESSEVPRDIFGHAPPWLEEFQDRYRTFAVPTTHFNTWSIEIVHDASSRIANAVYERLHPRADA